VKIRLIFQQSFIAPVEGSKMEHSFSTVVVDVPETVSMLTNGGKKIKPILIGGEWVLDKEYTSETISSMTQEQYKKNRDRILKTLTADPRYRDKL
jgi:hypothetical protein